MMWDEDIAQAKLCFWSILCKVSKLSQKDGYDASSKGHIYILVRICINMLYPPTLTLEVIASKHQHKHKDYCFDENNDENLDMMSYLELIT